jgi:HAD superfamily hydrolase (TIGR01509 family)
MPIDLIIFDMDGVLIDSEILSCGTLLAALADIGVEIDIDVVFDRFLGRSFGAVERDYLERTGETLPDDFRPNLRRRLFEGFRRELRPMPGAPEMLVGLDRRYCLASSSDAERITLSLEITGLTSFFGPRIFNSAMVARGKPAPDLFLHAALAMRTAPHRTLVVEDSVTGVIAGKAAGMTVWGFTGGSHYRGRDAAVALLEAGADRIVDSLAALPLPLAEATR